MKILLANPAAREPLSGGRERYFIKAGSRWPWSYVKRVGEDCRPPFPFFLAYAASVLAENAFDVTVVDGVALDMSAADFLARVAVLSPDMIVIETVMHAFLRDMNLATELKRLLPQSRLVLTGPFATTYAAKILKDHPAVDFVLMGEYELTVLRLAETLRRGEGDFRLPGTACREGGAVWVSKEKGFIPDINRLPSPAFHLFPANDRPDLGKYGDGICTYQPAVTLHASRGCPFRCDFCLWNQVMYDNRGYRLFEAERVVDEMAYVIERFGAREIYFDDDNFCVNKQHVLEICNLIVTRGLKIKWSCMGDAMSSDEEMIEAMANAGCIFMKFGVESGDKGILKRIGKPLDPERAVQVAKWCRKHGIMTHATFVFGLYGETFRTMRKTVALANRIPFDYAQASIATPFPGTRFFDKLARGGAAARVLDYGRFDGARACVFGTAALTAQQVVDFRKKAILSMVLHKLIDPGWWKNFFRRNRRLLLEYGAGRVLAPLTALWRLW